MILRLSQKLASKIGVSLSDVLPADVDPFADWSAHLFTADRTQYVIVTNTASLYSALMFGRGITNDSELVERGLDCIREVAVTDGLEFLYLRLVAPSAGTIRFSKSLNRSVTGSMNDLIGHAKFWLLERGLSPHDASFKLNDIPMSSLDYRNSREVFASLKPAG